MFRFWSLVFVLLDWNFVPHCLTLPFTFYSLLSMIILLFVHLVESLGTFICWFCSCLEMFSIIPHFIKHMPRLFIVFVTHLQYFWSFFCGMFFLFGFYVLDNNFCLLFLVLWLRLSFPFWFLDLSCRWSWLSIFWHSWCGWLTSFVCFCDTELVILFYPSPFDLCGHTFSSILSNPIITYFPPFYQPWQGTSFLAFNLQFLYQCALFWIIFLAAVFDLAYGFLISTVLITPVFVFSLCHGRFMLFFSFLGDYSCICQCLSLPVMTLCFDFVLCFAQLFFWFYSCFMDFLYLWFAWDDFLLISMLHFCW